jgi:hypothetical protein
MGSDHRAEHEVIQRQEHPSVTPDSTKEQLSHAGNDRHIAGDHSPKPSDKLPEIHLYDSAATDQLIADWKKQTNLIVVATSNDTDHNGRIQAGVYKVVDSLVKETGLAKDGWCALPTAAGSALDRAGADIVLVNKNTHEAIFLDATSGNKGEFNLSRFQRQGVIEVNHSWFEINGNLNSDSAQALEFKDGLARHLKDITRPEGNGGSPKLNLTEVKLPNHLPSSTVEQDLHRFAEELRQEARKSDDTRAAILRELADKQVTRSENYAMRQRSAASGENAPLLNEIHKTSNTVVFNATLKALGKEPAAAPSDKATSTGAFKGKSDHSEIIYTKPGSHEQLTGGNPKDAINHSIDYWLKATENSQEGKDRLAELSPRLSKKGIDPQIFLTTLRQQRRVFEAGGLGGDKPIFSDLMNRLNHIPTEKINQAFAGTPDKSTLKANADNAIPPNNGATDKAATNLNPNANPPPTELDEGKGTGKNKTRVGVPDMSFYEPLGEIVNDKSQSTKVSGLEVGEVAKLEHLQKSLSIKPETTGENAETTRNNRNLLNFINKAFSDNGSGHTLSQRTIKTLRNIASLSSGHLGRAGALAAITIPAWELITPQLEIPDDEVRF